MISEPPLVFVYLGGVLPRYSFSSLAFAAKAHQGKTVLLTDAGIDTKKTPRFDTVQIGDWYDPTAFEKFRENSTLDKDFRSGFWLHAVERFFVLRQYMSKESLGRLFHAELDVMVFDLHGVANACDSHARGVFAVMDSPDRALASLFYTNSAEGFDHFLEYVSSHPDNRNEMEILGAYLTEFPRHGHSFPSDSLFYSEPPRFCPSVLDDKIGVFDASALGQWLFGIDPRNVAGCVKNKFRNDGVGFPIESLRFSMSAGGRQIMAFLPGGPKHQVRTLHIHSKIVRRLRKSAFLGAYLWMNRLPFRLPITGWKRHIVGLTLSALLRGRKFEIVRLLNQLNPGLWPRALLRLAGSAELPLSIRQRRQIVSLFRPFTQLPARGEPIRHQLIEEPSVSHQEGVSVDFPGIRVADKTALGGDDQTLRESASFRQILRWLFETEEQAVTVHTSSAPFSESLGLVTGARISLVVSEQKFEREWAAVSSRWGLALQMPLSFSPDLQVLKPSWVRAMCPNGLEELEGWLSASAQPSWPLFVQAYGGWVITNHPESVRLTRVP